MSIEATSSASQSSPMKNKKIMKKDDFLQMFVTTLKYQDPLNPMSNEQFASQLASFSQLEELQNMNTSMDNMLNSNLLMTQSINNSLATTFIGKEVKTSGSDFQYKTGDGDKTLNFNLEANSTKVNVKVYNESGDLVRTIEKSNFEKGKSSVEWDGRTDAGSVAGDGKYRYIVEAFDENEKIVKSTPFQLLKVTGVKYVDGMANLIAGDNLIPLNKVAEILTPSNPE
jgi:flagellar basal-body rod modification protein FlgD